LLQTVYKNEALPLAVRMNAASMAAKFERPVMTIVKDAGSSDSMSVEERRRRVEELMDRHRIGASIDAE
jgi:acetyl-CoA carboxylase alpha subunit